MHVVAVVVGQCTVMGCGSIQAAAAVMGWLNTSSSSSHGLTQYKQQQQSWAGSIQAAAAV
jgi:hypothetical protein